MLPVFVALTGCSSSQVRSRCSLAAPVWVAVLESPAFDLFDVEQVPCVVSPEMLPGLVES